MKKQIRAALELLLGFVGMMSPTDWFKEVFFELFKSGNRYTVIGYVTVFVVGLVSFLDSIAVLLDYKHLGEMMEDIF